MGSQPDGGRPQWDEVAAVIKTIQRETGFRSQWELWKEVKKSYGCAFESFKDNLRPRRTPFHVDRFIDCMAKVFAQKWPRTLEQPLKEREYLARLRGAYFGLSERGQERVDDGSERNNVELEPYYPNQHRVDFLSADELWLTGGNMRRLVSDDGAKFYLAGVRELLSKKKTVRVLMHHPKSDVCEYAFKQDPAGAQNLAAYRRIVRDNLDTLIDMRDRLEGGENLKIRTIDYMLAFGLDIMNLRLNDDGEAVSMNPDILQKGIIWVRLFPIPKGRVPFNDRPIIRLTYSHRFWLGFFAQQFEYHWATVRKQGWATPVRG